MWLSLHECMDTFVQGLAYYGYIEVNQQRLEGEFLKALDLNQDGKVGTAFFTNSFTLHDILSSKKTNLEN